MALTKIDAIINTIKKSKDKEVAKANLMKKFKLTERQSVAILEMRLQALAGLERLKVEQELKEKLALIKELESILKSPKRILDIIKKELSELKEKYGDERKTKVVGSGAEEFSAEDLIPNEDTIVAMTESGYIKRLTPDTFKTQSRGGKGVMGLATKEEDVVSNLLVTTTHADLLFFTTSGRVFQLKAYEVPQASRTAKGQAIVNFLQLNSDEKVTSILSMEEVQDYKYFMMETVKGSVKKVPIDQFKNIRRSGLIAIKLRKNDSLKWVDPSTGKDDVVLATKKGQSIRIAEKNIRAMGRNAAGVKSIRLKADDEVVGMDVVSDALKKDGQLLVVMSNGFGKRTGISQYKVQGRGGSGVKTASVTAKTGEIVYATVVNAKSDEGDIIIISNKGQVIRLPLKSVNILGRATQGVRLMRFKAAGDKVASVSFI